MKTPYTSIRKVSHNIDPNKLSRNPFFEENLKAELLESAAR